MPSSSSLKQSNIHKVLGHRARNESVPGQQTRYGPVSVPKVALAKYLAMQEDESVSESSHGYWKPLGDGGYIGPQEVPLPKYSYRSFSEEEKELVKLRVPIEKFFGRRVMFWPVTKVPYPFGPSHHDSDLKIVMPLINEVSGSLEEGEDYAQTYREYEYLNELGGKAEETRQKWREKKARIRKMMEETQTDFEGRKSGG